MPARKTEGDIPRDLWQLWKAGALSAEEVKRLARLPAEERQNIAAEADARFNWLKKFAEHLKWFETFVSSYPDDYLRWYTAPGSPGMYDHGITAERLAATIAGLERARRLAFGGPAEFQRVAYDRDGPGLDGLTGLDPAQSLDLIRQILHHKDVLEQACAVDPFSQASQRNLDRTGRDLDAAVRLLLEAEMRLLRYDPLRRKEQAPA
jgi:hypothetical protein